MPKRLIIISLVICIFSASGCKKAPVPELPAATNLVVADPQQAEAAQVEYLLVKLQQVNPFKSDHAVGVPKADVAVSQLKGIIWDEKFPYALIGTSVVIEGDIIAGKKVIKINKDSVVLDNNGKEEIMKLELKP